MKRYVRTFTDIYDTTQTHKNVSCWDEHKEIEGYYNCDGKLVMITMWECEPIEYKAHFLGFIIKQSDTFEDLLTDKDFVRDKYVFIESEHNYKRVAYYSPEGVIVL